jgi:hypothetical protein
MGIRMVRADAAEDVSGFIGGFVPRLACDYCGLLLDDAEDGLVVWAMDGGLLGRSLAAEAAYIAHRGACAQALTQRTESAGQATMWGDLWELPIHLANNSTPEARRTGARPLVQPTPAHPHHADLPSEG